MFDLRTACLALGRVTMMAAMMATAAACGTVTPEPDESTDPSEEQPGDPGDGDGDTGDGDMGDGDMGDGDTGDGDTGDGDTGDGDTGDGDGMMRMDAGMSDAGMMGDGDAAMPVTCGDLSCDPLATCDDTGDAPVCTCPDGYSDANGDGSACEDIDECADPTANDCARAADCENTDGGYTCTCRAPRYAGDGKTCDCAEGYEPAGDGTGRCVGSDGTACEGDLDCASDACESGICCAQACNNPGTCETSEGATCSDGSTCVYAMAEAGTVCNDGNACTDGACDADGVCQGTPFDVAERCNMASSCQAASCVPDNGCIYTSLAEGTDCDDGNPCTVIDRCDDQGQCAGSGLPQACDDDKECTADACMAMSASKFVCENTPVTGDTCAAPSACFTGGVCDQGQCLGTGNACGDGDPTCEEQGDTIMCTCAEPDYVEDPTSDLCVPNVNECETANPCDPAATCADATPTLGDATCTCPPDLAGDGFAAGTGCYQCTGNLSKAVGGTCVCDLGGTFAFRLESTLDLTHELFEDFSGVKTYSWTLRTHSYDNEGNLQVVERACGGTTPELCVGGVLDEAFSGGIPFSTFDAGTIPATSYGPIMIPDARPGQPFPSTTDTQPFPDATVVSLTGVNLTAQERANFYWPAAWDDREGIWPDVDGDGKPGVTTEWLVPDDGSTSSVCPRSGSGSYEYAYPPASLFLSPRVDRVYGASQVISTLVGTIDDCDTITGEVRGRNEDEFYVARARVLGCRVASSGSDCSAGQTTFLDGGANDTPTVTNATFVIERIPEGMPATCETVRALLPEL